MYTIGSVPYVNARPLVRYFEEEPGRYPVEVVYDVPSRLPALLENGDADVVLASSIEALLAPGRSIAAGLCIASHGPVLSVRLFSKGPFSEIRTLALDQSSLTSNSLAQIVLLEKYGIQPSCAAEPPSLADMLESYDACVLIGDIGMRAEGTKLHVLDLGEEWTNLTGLPFVWALWIGETRLDEELCFYLRAARLMSCLGAKSPSRPEAMPDGISPADDVERVRFAQLQAISSSSAWTLEEVRRYLMETIIFDLGEKELEGLREFGKRLVAHNIAPARCFPILVEAKHPLKEAFR